MRVDVVVPLRPLFLSVLVPSMLALSCSFAIISPFFSVFCCDSCH